VSLALIAKASHWKFGPNAKAPREAKSGRFFLADRIGLQLTGDSQSLVCKHRSEAPRLVLIVQQDDGDYTKITFARVALCDFTLQILHEAICKVILSALATGIFLIAVAAVGTMKFYGVQLRIAVQSCPAGAAHPDRFGIMPFHGKPSSDR